MSQRHSYYRSKGQNQGSRFGNQNDSRGFRNSRNNNRGGGRRGGGRRQATFDPSNLILSLANQVPTQVHSEEYVGQNHFGDFNISNELKLNIADRGYESPTPIQDQIIPHIIKGKDVVGIANTGTGKTAAFLIPLLNKVIQDRNERVLIITPTRELADQIREELFSFSKGLQIHATLCIGGSNISRQMDQLRRSPSFVIGTPGRIKDLNQRGKLRFNQFTNIVLDEVDRMLDMGFVHEITQIIDALPRNRSSLFFSATMTDSVKKIMDGFLTNPVHISVKTQDTAMNVKQEIVKIGEKPKLEILHDLLSLDEFEKVLVFGRTKHGAQKLTRILQNRGHKVDAIHGNKSQSQRQRALKQFKDNRINVLIATDVIARGVDIDDVTHVINYDLPESYENYIHRIGRTGRANKTGVALTFVE